MIQIVDSHLHLWDTTQLRYPWLEEFKPLADPHLRADFDQAVLQVPEVSFAGAIVVQADASVELAAQEVELVSQMSGSTPLLGMVAYAPLETGTECDSLLQHYGQLPFVVGVRRAIQNEKTAMVTSSAYLHGLELAASQGLAIDMCLRHFQMDATLQAIEATLKKYPDARFVLDHAGKPPLPTETEQWQLWADSLQKLAALPQVFCKLSGLLTEFPSGTQAKLAVPSMEKIIEAFGPSRTMFGSDWPVVELADPLPVWVQLTKTVLAGLDLSDQKRIWADTAMDFYQVQADKSQK